MDDIRWLDGSDDLHEAFAIRLEVFCDEQGYSPEMELDELDRTSRHVLLYRGDEPVATGRLYEKRGSAGWRCGGRGAVPEWAASCLTRW